MVIAQSKDESMHDASTAVDNVSQNMFRVVSMETKEN